MAGVGVALFGLLVVVVLVISKYDVLTNHNSSATYPTAADAMMPFDASSPGLGRDLYREEVEEHAMAYGLYASAAAMLGMTEQARIAADWLVENPSKTEVVGWGLPFAWDAFGDDSVNPETTIYGVTTAIAVRGLLDVYELTGDMIYRDIAIQALEDYVPYFHESEHGGYFGYSDSRFDQVDTHNISGILMGQYARAVPYDMENRYREITDKLRSHLDRHREFVDGHYYWRYSERVKRPNDLVHAAYIVQGYLDYARFVDNSLDLDPVVEYLDRFFDGNSVYEFPDHREVAEGKTRRPARGWGVGMLIHVLADHGDVEGATRAAHALTHYHAGDNVFSIMPDRSEFIPRIQAHVVFGLARLETASAARERRGGIATD